jgi:2-C-methyl-D-erythritol 4-phosphate cytidylyltransferase/2-C-methyl-D-erythritol 2,4-cyclodiphosphate synthase
MAGSRGAPGNMAEVAVAAGPVAAVVVAAGRGTRAGGKTPKQFRELAGQTLLSRSLAVLVEHPKVTLVQPVIGAEDGSFYEAAAGSLQALAPVHGGATRQASVRAGLDALAPHRPRVVLVHETLDRSRLRLIQTPQAFSFAPLLEAHRRAAAAGRHDFTDDAALAEWAGMKVAVFAGDASNIKITDAEDFARMEAVEFANLGDVRTGGGLDVHAFGPGDHVTLGGIRIPHTHALLGHSDADVVLHALTDAILGALADGDIGAHFPPSDPQWRDASSDRFLAFAAERVRNRGGRIAHLDATVICEAPRLGPYRDPMRASIAAIADIAVERVGVKATTSERLGFTGRGEGIAASATATIRLPWS